MSRLVFTLESNGRVYRAEIVDIDLRFEWRVGELSGTARITRDSIEIRVTGGRLRAIASMLVKGGGEASAMLEAGKLFACMTGKRVIVVFSRLLPSMVFEPDSCEEEQG